jgi:hypothetical protein
VSFNSLRAEWCGEEWAGDGLVLSLLMLSVYAASQREAGGKGR